MRRLFFSYMPFSNSPGLFLLRLLMGILMLTHGLPKLKNALLGNLQFGDPVGLGEELSLYLAVFAEVICSVLIILGLFTRLALIPLMTTMAIAVLIVHKADPFDVKELPLLYLGISLALFLTGPGKFSLDRFILKEH